MSQEWEEEAGTGGRVKASWEKFHRGEIQSVPGTSTVEIRIPGAGKGGAASFPLKMARIPAGSFLMGDDKASPTHPDWEFFLSVKSLV